MLLSWKTYNQVAQGTGFFTTQTFVQLGGTSKGPSSKPSNNISSNYASLYLKIINTHSCDSSTVFGGPLIIFYLKWNLPTHSVLNILITCFLPAISFCDFTYVAICVTWENAFLIESQVFTFDQGRLRLRAQGGYLSNIILKWLTQKLYLENCDWFAIAIHNPISGPKGVRTLKMPWIFKVWSQMEIFYNSINLYHTEFLLWVIELIILIFRVSNNSK